MMLRSCGVQAVASAIFAVTLGAQEVDWPANGRDLPARLMDSVRATRIPVDWGSPNLGGPIVTAGGVVFIGAALDRWLHAYDIDTGRELWRGRLPESGKATPMSYRLASGDQFVAIAVGGGEEFGKGDYVVAFRLPRPR